MKIFERREDFSLWGQVSGFWISRWKGGGRFDRDTRVWLDLFVSRDLIHLGGLDYWNVSWAGDRLVKRAAKEKELRGGQKKIQNPET